MRHWIMILLLAGITIGCEVDQKKEVAYYRNVIELTSSPVEYQAGEPLTLTKAVLLTNQIDESLSSKGEEYLQAEIIRRRDTANFLPKVDLVPVYSRRDKVYGQTGTTSQYHTFDMPLSASMNLFNGLQDVNRAWRDDFIIEQKRYELLSSQEQLLLDAVTIFYQVLRSEASVGVLESSLVLQNERLRDAKGRLEAGVASSLAASQTEAQIAGTMTTLISAKSDVVQARSRLALLSGADIGNSRLVEDWTPLAIAPLEQLIQVAQLNRDDLKAADYAVQAARKDVDAAIGQYYPSVTIDLNQYLARESLPAARSWDALLTVNIPIFTGGAIHQEVRFAWSNFRQALLARSAITRRIRSEIETSYADVMSSRDRINQLKVQADAAQDVLNQAEQSYRAGRATNLDRIQAQDALLQAQLQQASEMYDQKLFHLILIQRTGRLKYQFKQSTANQPQG